MFLFTYLAVLINSEFLGLDKPWNYIFSLVVALLPLILYNVFIPTKCPNTQCKKFTLYSEDLFTHMAPFYFRCKSCDKRYRNENMQNEDISNT